MGRKIGSAHKGPGPLLCQRALMGNSNFAEVGFCVRHLIQNVPSLSINSGKDKESSRLNFVFQV